MSVNLIRCVIVMMLFEHGLSLMCYRCAPSMPGCNEPFNWRGMGYLGDYCPEDNDVCVKLIERKGSDVQITRDCLSNLAPVRTDHPTDLYEGCIHSSRDVRLANYVNNSIKEYDVKRDHFDETTWCYCYLDHRCNGTSALNPSGVCLFLVTALFLIYSIFGKNRN